MRRNVTYLNGVTVQQEDLVQNKNGTITWDGIEYGDPVFSGMQALNAVGELVDVYNITLPFCENTRWKEVDREFTKDVLKYRPVGFYKYRLRFIYDRENARIRSTSRNVLVEDFIKETAKIYKIMIIDNYRQLPLEEGVHYTIAPNGYVWFLGTWPYPELKIMIDWLDTTTNETKTTEYITDTIIDDGYGGAAEKRNNVFTITQTGQSVLFSENLNFVASLYSTPGINSIISANPLGMWREPLIYTINGGECYVEVGIDGSLKYLDSNKIETTADEIFKKSLLRNPFGTGLNLTNKSVKEFETGENISGKPAIGLFQIVEPNVSRLNWNIKNKKLAELSGIRTVDVKPKGFLFRTYFPIPVNTPDAPLQVGMKMFIDNRRIQAVPYRRCFEGLRTEYSLNEEFIVYFEREQPCFSDSAGAPAMQFSSSIEIEEGIVIDWEGQRVNKDLPDCECLRVRVIKEPYEEQRTDCGCRQVTRSDIYEICPESTPPAIYADYESKIRTDGSTIFTNPPTGLTPILSRVERIEKCKDKPLIERTDFTYHKILDSDIIVGNIQSVVGGMFSAEESVDCYVTNSIQTGSNDYYYNITGCNTCDSSSYFTVSYGNAEGSGSTYDSQYEYKSPSKVIYSKYRLMALESPETNFSFYYTGSIETPKDIYSINFYRESYGDRIDPGNFEISLQELNGTAYPNGYYTGSNVQPSSSNKIISLVDNSEYINESNCEEDPYASYDLVSGSLIRGIYNTGTGSITTNTQYTTYGKVYPTLGLIVLNGNRLNAEVSFNSVSGSNIDGDNSLKIFTAISGAASLGYSIRARKVKERGVSHYIVRVPASEATYTNNPSAINSIGRLKYDCMSEQPITYVTTVGLYNDDKDLIAVAKFNKPIKKEHDDDLFIKIKMAKQDI